MADMRDAFRICATCRHLEIIEQGRAFEMIVDTEFMRFRCAVLGTTGREDYLMAPVETELPAEAPAGCRHWASHRAPHGENPVA